MKARIEQAVLLAIASFFGALPTSGWGGDPGDVFPAPASWSSYRFRPVEGRSTTGPSQAAFDTTATSYPEPDARLLAQGWRFRPLTRKPRAVASPAPRAETPLSAGLPLDPALDTWSLTAIPPPPPVSAPVPATWTPPVVATPSPHPVTDSKPRRGADVYVMFHGTRYRFRAPRDSRAIPPLDPSSSYLGEDSLFAGQAGASGDVSGYVGHGWRDQGRDVSAPN